MIAKLLMVTVGIALVGAYHRRRRRKQREAELPTFRDAWRIGKGGRPFLPPEE
jgi:hypothetical protein